MQLLQILVGTLLPPIFVFAISLIYRLLEFSADKNFKMLDFYKDNM